MGPQIESIEIINGGGIVKYTNGNQTPFGMGGGVDNHSKSLVLNVASKTGGKLGKATDIYGLTQVAKSLYTLANNKENITAGDIINIMGPFIGAYSFALSGSDGTDILSRGLQEAERIYKSSSETFLGCELELGKYSDAADRINEMAKRYNVNPSALAKYLLARLSPGKEDMY